MNPYWNNLKNQSTYRIKHDKCLINVLRKITNKEEINNTF